MAEEVHVPGIGGENKKTVVYVAGAAGVYVAYRWWKSRRAAAAAAANGPAPLPPVDTSNTAAGQGAAGFTNPDPGAGTASYNSGALTSNAQWSAKVEQDLVNMGYDGQTVATALGLYLSSQPLTLDQQTIVRVAWAMDGKPPETSNLAIIPAQTPPTQSPPPPSTTPPPPAPAPAPDPHAGMHWQNPQVATLMPGVSLRKWQSWYPHNNLRTLIALNPSLNPDNANHPRMFIRTSDGRWVPN